MNFILTLIRGMLIALFMFVTSIGLGFLAYHIVVYAGGCDELQKLISVGVTIFSLIGQFVAYVEYDINH